MFLHLQSSRKLVNTALILMLCACTPTLNWREVRLESDDGSTLKAALPCKPDSATRKQQLAGIQIDLSMMGCKTADSSNDITFTLSRIPIANALDSPKVLAAWQAAAVSNLGAKAAPLVTAAVSGAGVWPPAAKVTLSGAATQAHMLWFAKQTATGVTLYQAAVYGKQPSKDAMTEATMTFFESLQLQ
jgi:hypothetical protein